MGRRGIVLIASIVVAAIGTTLIALYVAGADSRMRSRLDLVTVWVANREFSAGTSLEEISRCACLRHVTATGQTAAGSVDFAARPDLTLRARGPVPAGTVITTRQFSSATSSSSNATEVLSIPIEHAPELTSGDVAVIYVRPSDLAATEVVSGVTVFGTVATDGQPALQLTLSKEQVLSILSAESKGDLVASRLRPAPR